SRLDSLLQRTSDDLRYSGAADLDGEFPCRTLPHAMAHSLAQILVAEQQRDPVGERAWIVARDQETIFAVADEIRYRADGGGDDGQPCGHRLRNHERKRLGPRRH